MNNNIKNEILLIIEKYENREFFKINKKKKRFKYCWKILFELKGEILDYFKKNKDLIDKSYKWIGEGKDNKEILNETET